MGISISNQLLGSTGLSVGLGLSRGNGLSFGGFAGGPALYLPFALTGTLDPRVTFSRPSLATMYDSTGKLTYAPNNLLLQSQTLETTWGTSSITVTVNASAAPDGTITADLLTPTANNNTHRIQQLVTNSSAFVYSIYVKPNGYTKIGIWDYATTGAYASFDCSGAGSVLDSGVGGTSPAITSVGNGWYRLSFKATVSGSVGFAIQVLAPSYTTGGVSSPWLADGISGAYVWGAQLEAVTYQTTPSTYNATTSAAYYGPRFDYNPATLVARGLLIEEARTNTITSSQNFSGTGWFVDGAVLTPNAGVAPDGTNTATSIVAGTGNNRVYQFDNSGVTGNKVASFYVKSNAGSSISIEATGAMTPSGPAVVNTATGTVTGFSGASVVPIRDGWFRVFLPVSVTTASGNSTYWLISGPASSVFIWGAQLEAGAFATSYIPTAASAVARSADSATMTGTNFSSWYNQTQGTFVVNGLRDNDANGARLINVWNGTLAEKIEINFANSARASGVVSVANVSQAGFLTSNGTAPANQNNKMALAYVIDNFAFSLNAATPLTDTSGLVPVVNEMQIGSQANAGYLNGWIASLAYYNTRLPNATLQSLTLPVIADYYFLVTAGGDQLTDASDNPLYTQPLYL